MCDLEKLLTVSEIAAHLRISKKQAYRIVESKGFPSIRIGRRILIPEEKYKAWIDHHIYVHP